MLLLRLFQKIESILICWDQNPHYEVEHISHPFDLGRYRFTIAPATYNIIGKVANGIADDMLLASRFFQLFHQKTSIFAPCNECK